MAWIWHARLIGFGCSAGLSYHCWFEGSNGMRREIPRRKLAGRHGLRVAGCWVLCLLVGFDDFSCTMSYFVAFSYQRQQGLSQASVLTNYSRPYAVLFYLYSVLCGWVRLPFAEFGDVDLPRVIIHNLATLSDYLALRRLPDDFQRVMELGRGCSRVAALTYQFC